MTDRLLIVLEQDSSQETTDAVLAAVRQLRGVQSADPYNHRDPTTGSNAAWAGDENVAAKCELSQDRKQVTVWIATGSGASIDSVSEDGPGVVLDMANPTHRQDMSSPFDGPIGAAMLYSATFYSDGLIHTVHLQGSSIMDPGVVLFEVDDDVARFAHP